MKVSAKLCWIPCAMVPFAFAICFNLWAATICRESASFAACLNLAAIPCGLLGLSASLMIAFIRSHEDRITKLARRLDEQEKVPGTKIV